MRLSAIKEGITIREALRVMNKANILTAMLVLSLLGVAPQPAGAESTDHRAAGQIQIAEKGVPDDAGMPDEVPESFHGDPRSGNQGFKTTGTGPIRAPKQASEEPDDSQDDDVPAAGTSSGRQPFNLGAKKSYIEGDVDDSALQSGAAQQGKMPAFDLNAQRSGFNLDAQQSNLQGGTGQFGSQAPLKGGASGTELKGGLTEVQMKKLANHDMVLIIDRSGSMLTPDCPVAGVGRTAGTLMSMLMGASMTRWDWCRAQTLRLAKETQYVCSRGFTVVLFSSNYQIFQNVSLNQIPQIFAHNDPSGGTNLHDPLNATLVDYFQRRKILKNVKPLAIAIVTDGRPNSTDAVTAILVNATKYMQSPSEVSVTFFLIGDKILNGQAYITELEQNFMRYGAKYPIVRSVSFWNLEKIGLPRALADTLSE